MRRRWLRNGFRDRSHLPDIERFSLIGLAMPISAWSEAVRGWQRSSLDSAPEPAAIWDAVLIAIWCVMGSGDGR